MNWKILCALCSLVATFLFLLAVGYDGWNCGGSILSNGCLRFVHLKVTGALLLTAGLVVFISSILLILEIVCNCSCSGIAACAFAVISTMVSITAVAYYASIIQLLSPFFATAAMTLTVALSLILIFDMATKRFSTVTYVIQSDVD
ncbi:expressed conserved protein [Echinococcus multilocularis]|uniref:Expressed conserved protein n=1 Tax=Echinococcus multilocularis TaxID=6211 RepID=A0A087VXU8_ECHMU|nr:expressed conserved protein [Echinococcus multilocularis]